MTKIDHEKCVVKIVKDLGNNSKGYRKVLCECGECEAKFERYYSYCLVTKLPTCTKCSRKNRKTGHGDAKKTSKYHRLYRIYLGMKQRCYNPKNDSYIHYGASSITVCDEWFNDYLKFKEWAIPAGYTDDLTIERIDVSEGYSPSNCTWLTISDQAFNKRVICSKNKSGYKGVSWNVGYSKWEVSIGINRIITKIGYYFDKLEAAKAYDSYVLDNNLKHSINGVLAKNERVKSNTGNKLISTNKSGYVGVNSPIRLAKYKKKYSTSVEYKGKKVFSGNFSSLEEAAFARDTFLRSSDLYKRSKKNFTDEQFLQLQQKYTIT